ncbi:hypothetical protein [Acidaminococcus massiliensis]|jgi:hypothetical protein|uniref:hypothetical protein n=1 Tax=Acidaminococcus massiliensis TaxID=1852375 RepID=UPI00094E7C41|nr:hypothetical protein [Acidaminococcus massiliensis]
MKKQLYAILAFGFEITMVLYMLMGLTIVFVQCAGILMYNPSLVFTINSMLKMPATWLSSISGLCGFAAWYVRPNKKKVIIEEE